MAAPSNSRTVTDGMFVFTSRPRIVNARDFVSKKHQPLYDSIMHDRLVVRRNHPDLAVIQQASRRRAIVLRQARENLRTKTPEALQGRQHVDVQTDCYLEELSNVIEVNEIECQTDEFLDKPATPLFIPAKSGVDAETQIEEGELFDFDLEVQPVLEVLIGKTIEQSLLEVMEEEELACLRTQQRIFQELRNSELAEVQRLEEQERRRREEKERRVAQQKEVLKKERETAEKIGARVFSQQYLASLVPAVFTSLRNHGYFYDPVEKDLEMNFLPWLMVEVNNQLQKRYTARKLLDTIIYEVTQKRLEEFNCMDNSKP